MFSNQNPADNLASALAEYQKDFEKRLLSKPNPTAEDARKRLEQANELVRQSGLGDALTTLLAHTEHWPTWSQRSDFQQYVGFPLADVLTREERHEENYRSTKIITVYFVYQTARYGMVFKDKGSSIMFDGDFRSGMVEFIANDEIVLGLDISLGEIEFANWHWFGVNALRMGDWSKHLLEIAAYIRSHDKNSLTRRNDEYDIDKAKNISLQLVRRAD